MNLTEISAWEWLRIVKVKVENIVIFILWLKTSDFLKLKKKNRIFQNSDISSILNLLKKK